MSLVDNIFDGKYESSYYDSIQEEIQYTNESEDGDVFFDAFDRLEFINSKLNRSLKMITELEFRLNHTNDLLLQAKCPNDCNGKCTWCYEREVELNAQKTLLEKNESE